jgi:TPR repeat protein
MSWLTNLSIVSTPEAQITIGTMYKDGLGVYQDIEKAISWYTKAAEVGLVEA